MNNCGCQWEVKKLQGEGGKTKLKAVPLSQKQANEFVSKIHRHHAPAVGDKFRLGCELDGKLCGVAQVGRPVSRYLDDGKTLEVIRLATDGTKNACSFLYSRCARIARDLGYSKIITYILDSESGNSLTASGWVIEELYCGGGSWNCNSRPRMVETVDLFGETTKYPTEKKKRYAKYL